MRRYVAAWCYLGGFAAVQGAYLILPVHARASLLAFASTNGANLEHDPVGSLVVSAFLTGGGPGGSATWLPLIAIGMFGACRAVGGARTAAVCAAGHVIGTLVSEGIVAWRVHAGALPASYLHLTDVGPSYVVVSALVVTMLCAPWSWRDRTARAYRVLAAVEMLLLVFPGQIFSGLTSLDVAAVGHVTAIAAASAAALFLLRRRSAAAAVGRGGV